MLLDSRYIKKNGSKVPIEFLPRLETLEKKVSKLESSAIPAGTVSAIPVGTVIASTLEFEKFTIHYNPENVEVTNTKEVLWVPADGRSVQDSEYKHLTGKDYVPDLRGVFLRGMNEFYTFGSNGKVKENQADPKKKRVVGDFQEDSLQNHDHNHRHKFQIGGSSPARTIAAGSGKKDNTDGETELEEKTPISPGKYDDIETKYNNQETRPKNRSVYYYIKIN